MFKNFALIMAAATIVATPLAAQTVNAPDPVFQTKLRAALQAEPEMVLAALQQAQGKIQAQQDAQRNASVSTFLPELQKNPAIGPVLGNKTAKITIGELLDYNCHFCRQVNSEVEQLLQKRKDVRVVVVMRPILGPTSETLARFALAADMQGKFPAVHNALYAADPRPDATDEGLQKIATATGVDFAKAKRDMTSPAVDAKIKEHTAYAEKLGVNGTPFFVTPGGAIPGAAPLQRLEDSLTAK